MAHLLARIAVSVVLAVPFVIVIVAALLRSQGHERAIRPAPPRAPGPRSSQRRVH